MPVKKLRKYRLVNKKIFDSSLLFADRKAAAIAGAVPYYQTLSGMFFYPFR